ncbi:tyrosine-type recombinase/integrase [Enterococcus xiangfangensis]|uniref:tyrosine-type recombinase/integrase n=1 Tax=Enterococcus xiangfangensis TaxID=1296537 RepID=UPI0030B8672A
MKCRKVGDLLNLDHLGTHTMRKTFGYTVYQNKKDIRLVMELLNHSSEKITLRYIGISEEQKKNTVENIDFFK